MEKAHAFDPASRVWVYTASRALTEEETQKMEQALDEFCYGWTAHDQQLHASGLVMHNRYVILVVDETQAGASGCSIDKSVHFLETIGKAIGVDFFTRNLVGFYINEKWEWHDFKATPELLKSGKVTAKTPVLDTTADTLATLKNWERPLADTWLSRYLKHAS